MSGKVNKRQIYATQKEAEFMITNHITDLFCAPVLDNNAFNVKKNKKGKSLKDWE